MPRPHSEGNPLSDTNFSDLLDECKHCLGRACMSKCMTMMLLYVSECNTLGNTPSTEAWPECRSTLSEDVKHTSQYALRVLMRDVTIIIYLTSVALAPIIVNLDHSCKQTTSSHNSMYCTTIHPQMASNLLMTE